MLSRREMLAITPLAAGGGHPSCPAFRCDRLATIDSRDVHRAGRCLRLPYPHLRRSSALPVRVWQDLHTGNGIRRRNARTASARSAPTRVVIVQPSVYGTDNGCTLDAIRQLAPNARGIAVIGDSTSDAALGRHASRRDPRDSDQPGHSRSDRP